MTWLRGFASLVLGVCCLLSPVFGQEGGTTPELAPGIALAHRVEGLKAALATDNPEKVRTAVNEVEVFRRTFGTHDVTPLVEAMTLWALHEGEAGNPVRGLAALTAVERWSPEHPTILNARITLMRQEGPKGYLQSLPEVVKLTRLRLVDPGHRWLWIIQHVAWLRMMVSVLLWGWAITLALRYRNVFRYLWEEPLSKRGMKASLIAGIGAVLVALPVLGGLDPSLAAMFWLWLLAPFMYGPEVKASLVVILLQLVHPALTLVEPEAARMPAPSLVALQLQPQTRSMHDLGLDRLPDMDRDFLAGWRQLSGQDWPAAEATFDRLSAQHTDRAEVLNNRGVARFQQGKTDEAKKDFDEAAKVNVHNLPEIPLNQSVVAFKLLDSSVGIAKQEEARLMAPDYAKGLMNANQSKVEQRTFAVPLPDSPERIALLQGPGTPVSTDLMSRLKETRILFWSGAVVLAAMAMLIRLRRSVKQVHPTQCTRCGEPFHTTDCTDVNVCSKCHHLFILKDGLHGESRKKKVEEVGGYQRSQRWIHKVLLLLAPGLGHSFMGFTEKGFMEFGCFAFAIGLVLATGRSVRFPGEIVPEAASAWKGLGLALLAFMLLRSWIHLIPRRRS